MAYTVVCPNGHRFHFDSTQFESFLAEGDFECPTCTKELAFDGREIILKCQVCGEEYTLIDKVKVR